MAKNIDSKCSQCRREGKKLFLKSEKCNSSKCPLIKRNYPPGVHGSKGHPRLTPYGTQLREKQQVKRMYRLMEGQFRKYYEMAVKKKSETGDTMIRLLESRFDNVIYRLGIAKSRALARQMVNHAHFTINGKKVNIPSYQVKQGDVIKIREKSLKKPAIKERVDNIQVKDIPNWLSWDVKELSARVVGDPVDDNLRNTINTKIIIEFYSR